MESFAYGQGPSNPVRDPELLLCPEAPVPTVTAEASEGTLQSHELAIKRVAEDAAMEDMARMRRKAQDNAKADIPLVTDTNRLAKNCDSMRRTRKWRQIYVEHLTARVEETYRQDQIIRQELQREWHKASQLERRRRQLVQMLVEREAVHENAMEDPLRDFSESADNPDMLWMAFGEGTRASPETPLILNLIDARQPVSMDDIREGRFTPPEDADSSYSSWPPYTLPQNRADSGIEEILADDRSGLPGFLEFTNPD